MNHRCEINKYGDIAALKNISNFCFIFPERVLNPAFMKMEEWPKASEFYSVKVFEVCLTGSAVKWTHYG